MQRKCESSVLEKSAASANTALTENYKNLTFICRIQAEFVHFNCWNLFIRYYLFVE